MLVKGATGDRWIPITRVSIGEMFPCHDVIRHSADHTIPCTHVIFGTVMGLTMMTSSNGNIFRFTGPLLNKQSWSGDLRHHRARCDVIVMMSMNFVDYDWAAMNLHVVWDMESYTTDWLYIYIYIYIYIGKHIQCDIVITHSILTKETPHDSSMGTRYGVPFVSWTSDLYSAAMLYVMSSYIGPRYNGTNCISAHNKCIIDIVIYVDRIQAS